MERAAGARWLEGLRSAGDAPACGAARAAADSMRAATCLDRRTQACGVRRALLIVVARQRAAAAHDLANDEHGEELCTERAVHSNLRARARRGARVSRRGRPARQHLARARWQLRAASAAESSDGGVRAGATRRARHRPHLGQLQLRPPRPDLLGGLHLGLRVRVAGRDAAARGVQQLGLLRSAKGLCTRAQAPRQRVACGVARA